MRLVAWILLLMLLFGVQNDGFSQPTKREVNEWLGTYQSGPERVQLYWDQTLRLVLDKIALSVDGRWHETVPTFAVRHRAGWVASGRYILLEEKHDEGRAWSYKLKLDDTTSRLLKLLISHEAAGEETLVRTYLRRDE